MGIPGSANLMLLGGGAQAYQIEQSLRFDGSSYMTRTPSSAGNRTTWTLSFWHKRSELGTGTLAGYQTVLAARSGSGDDTVRFDTSNKFKWFLNDTSDGNLDTSALHRDTSAWAHYVVVADYSNSTANDRNRMYINGVQVTDFSSRTNAPLNFSGGINNTVDQVVGRRWTGSTYYLRGYLAEVHLIDGTAVTDATDFGEYDDNGVWRPIEVTGLTYGTNGFYLKFDPSATNGIGHDHSGNGNNFSPSGFSTSGTGTDVMNDTPTSNYCVLNPLSYRDGAGAATLSEGNLRSYYASTSDEAYNLGTLGVTGGKFYWEYKLTAWTGDRIAGPVIAKQSWIETSGSTYYQYQTNGQKHIKGTSSSYGASFGVGDLIGVAMDFDGGELEFFKNGTSQGVAATDLHTYVSVAEPMFPGGRNNFGTTYIVNFGQRAFEQTPPTGYKALNTSNLVAANLKDGSDYFQTVTWTGDNTDDRSITVADDTSNSWQPDFVWYKRRNLNASHLLFDAVRGATKSLKSDSTDAEGTEPNALQAFESTGFQVGSDSNSNSSSYTYVAWNWLAGGSVSADNNTSGSINSTVSASAASGFSIVKYTGNNTAGATVGHGLGDAPHFIFSKNLDNSSAYWATYHRYLGTSKKLYLNHYQAPDTVSNWIDVSSSLITWNQNNANNVNENASDFICYCFTEIEGFSKFDGYQGNGSSDGPFVPTGFAVAWLMIKRTDTASEWAIYDNRRPGYNPTHQLRADQIDSENTGTNVYVDLLSNGFKIRTSDAAQNASTGSYVYAAFASHPFGGSNVTPAPAR